MAEYANFYCQCEVCFNAKAASVMQYRPKMVDGKVVMQCPQCKAITGQTIIRG
jgi:hypothetical protein